LASPTNAAAKRGALTGGALSDEALASSQSVLNPTRPGGGQRGLQQFFTPPQAAHLIARVFGSDCEMVLDPTAGNGALLAPYTPDQRFGIELDPDQIARGDYYSIQGDLQHIYPLLRCAGVRFAHIAVNPPFGLDWSDPQVSDGKKLNSTILAYRYALGLLSDSGQGVLIAGRDRFYKDILPRPEGQGFYAIVETPDLFDGVKLQTVLAFFATPSNRLEDDKRRPFKTTVDGAELDNEELAEAISVHRDDTCGYIDDSPTPYDAEEMRSAFDAAQKEHARRRKARKSPNDHDLYLRGAGKIGVNLSPLAQIALNDQRRLRDVQRLNNQATSYFAMQLREWRAITDLAEQGVITLESALAEHVSGVIAAAETLITPLYPVRAQQRLGFLDDQDSIKCLMDDPEKGYLAGERYPLDVESQVAVKKEERIVENREGEPVLRKFEKERKYLKISVGDHDFDEDPESIRYLTEHFEMPDPGDVATLAPEAVLANKELLQQIALDFNWAEKGLAYKPFQIEDLSRILVKGSGLVAWEMGLGKTMAQMVLAEASVRMGAENKALFVIPQDLLAQTQREAEKWFGRVLIPIRNQADARRVARHLAAGGNGWYVTWYEALSVVGRKDVPIPQHQLETIAQSRLRNLRYKRAQARRSANAPSEQAEPPRDEHEMEKSALLTTSDACPACHIDTDHGWSGVVCDTRKGGCGYVHRKLKIRSTASYLSTAFRHGVICVDELSLIKGDDSLRSRAVRALHAAHKYGFTGTPISNYVNDAFWGLWFCLSGAHGGSLRFPYDYDGGKEKFTADYCVVEYLMGREEEHEGHLRKRRKVLPEVTNLSVLWRLMASSMIRRRKEDTGEPIVPRRYVPISVPFGISQRAMHRRWLQKFPAFFESQYPQHALVRAGLVDMFAPALGQLWKLEFAATLPEGDPDLDWIVNVEHPEPLEAVSNWTPKNLKVLELILEQVEKGEKVLVGSDLIETGKWLCDRLTEKSVRAVNIVEENKRTGKHATKNPRDRAAEVTQFVVGDAQVLCVGVNAMRLGHNLDVASTVVLAGLPWDHAGLVQFEGRVWRLTSKKPVSVFVVLTRDSLDTRKWNLLQDKGAAADVALDGQLIDQPEPPIEWAKVIKEMLRSGVEVQGDEIPETEVEVLWDRIAPLAPPIDQANYSVVQEGPAPLPAGFRPIKPLKDVEQLALFG
jgi:hypothetical protein